jgi:plastocyanin
MKFLGRMFVAVWGGLVLALVLSGTVWAGQKASKEISIDNFSFEPVVTVAVGTRVTWVNHDDIPHTVVSEDLITFHSRPLDTDEKFSFTFEKAGTYKYFCSIHPKMTAAVVVR